MTTRIDARFAKCAAEGRAALVTFVMCGDPDLETSLAIVKALPGAGADVLEIGMPFTDPMADGPSIQAAGLRALKGGATLKKTLGLVADFRKEDADTPVVLMGYYNPIYVYGVDRFLVDAKAAGVDGLIVLTFDAGLAGIDAHAFVADVLAGRLGVSGVVAGYDFHFGKGRAGTPALLAQECARLGLAVEIVDKIAADARGSLDAVHSSGVRDALERGDVALARELLGRDYFVAGEVVHGQKLGRTIGFPTANLRLHESCALAHGIYAVRLKIDDALHDAVASWGRRPTVDNGRRCSRSMCSTSRATSTARRWRRISWNGSAPS